MYVRLPKVAASAAAGATVSGQTVPQTNAVAIEMQRQAFERADIIAAPVPDRTDRGSRNDGGGGRAHHRRWNRTTSLQIVSKSFASNETSDRLAASIT
jgi:hypothetical protein